MATVTEPAPPVASDPEDSGGDAAAADAGAASTSAGSEAPRRRSGPFRVHTAMCNGKSAKDLFSAVAAELGWPEVDVEARTVASVKRSIKPTLYCVMQTSDMLDVLPVMSARSWVSRYIGMPDLCDKGTFARIILACQDLVEEGSFSFSPKTWVLPDQLDSLKAKLEKSKKSATYIVKPEDGSQGDGIFLVQGVRDLEIKLSTKANKAAIVQRYIEKPLLLGGLKFDFRVYVCLIGGSLQEPPRIYVCREGLGRLCTEAYEEPTSKNMHKSMAHLTNYSLNKRSDRFEHSGESVEEVFSEASTSSKRPMTVVLRQLQAEHPDFDPQAFYDQVVSLVEKTVALMSPALTSFHRAHSETNEMRSFQVLGFDVMLDSRYVPYLLEVNNSPSLCIDEALPLDPGAPGSEERGGRPGRAREKDKVCLCMDMAQPHWHQTSVVDLAVKKTVMLGAFRLLEQLNAGIDEPSDESYVAASAVDEPIYGLMRTVEAFFHESGGAAKAFTSSGLRRALGAVCGTGGLQKHDLDSLSQRVRATQFTSHDRQVKPDALRVYDYLDVLRHVGGRAFPGSGPSAAVTSVLALAGK